MSRGHETEMGRVESEKANTHLRNTIDRFPPWLGPVVPGIMSGSKPSTVNNAVPTKKWRIAIGYDRPTFFFPKYWESIQDARLSYKNIINADLLKDRRVAEVVDVGG